MPRRKRMVEPDIESESETLEGEPVAESYRAHRTPIERPPLGRLRTVWHGPIGCGKTHFACSWPRAAILECERKASHIRMFGDGTEVFQFNNPTKYAAMVRKLVAEALDGKRKFDLVVFDTLPSYIRYVRRHLTIEFRALGLLKEPSPLIDIADYGKEGAGWGRINHFVTEALDSLYAVGYGWMVLAHTKRWRDDNSQVHYESVINAGIYHYLLSECDYMGHLKETVGASGHRHIVSFKPMGEGLPTRRVFPMSDMVDITARKKGVTAYQRFAESYYGEPLVTDAEVDSPMPEDGSGGPRPAARNRKKRKAD